VWALPQFEPGQVFFGGVVADLQGENLSRNLNHVPLWRDRLMIVTIREMVVTVSVALNYL